MDIPSFENHDTDAIRNIIILQPEVVQKVEQDLINIMSGGTAQDVDILLEEYSMIMMFSHVRF